MKTLGWLARMKSVELAKAKAGYFFDESKPQLTTSLGLNSGKENTRESNLEHNKPQGGILDLISVGNLTYGENGRPIRKRPSNT